MNELLPCPFCAGTDIRIDRHPNAGRGMHQGEDVYSMCCYDCGATFPNRYRRELLVECWNRRASPQVGGQAVTLLHDLQKVIGGMFGEVAYDKSCALGNAAIAMSKLCEIEEALTATPPAAVEPVNMDQLLAAHKIMPAFERDRFSLSMLYSLYKALQQLSFAAQITGGTAGRDENLCEAIAQAETVLNECKPAAERQL